MDGIDAHCHFWRLERGDYHWLAGDGGPLEAIRRDFLPGDYPGDLRCVVVQAAASEAETEFLLDLAAREPRILGVVGWVDLADEASAQTLARWAEGGRLRAIRPMLQDIRDRDWLVNHAVPAVVASLAELGLVFDALVTERHLPMLARFTDAHPELPLVVDHAAKPQPNRGEGWAAGMKTLAARSHVHCKLSGLLTELGEEDGADPLPALRRIVDPLLDWFGPERLIWGSDWPVVTLAASLERWRELTHELLRDLEPGERDAILGGNARRFYGLGS